MLAVTVQQLRDLPAGGLEGQFTLPGLLCPLHRLRRHRPPLLERVRCPEGKVPAGQRLRQHRRIPHPTRHGDSLCTECIAPCPRLSPLQHRDQPCQNPGPERTVRRIQDVQRFFQQVNSDIVVAFDHLGHAATAEGGAGQGLGPLGHLGGLCRTSRPLCYSWLGGRVRQHPAVPALVPTGRAHATHLCPTALPTSAARGLNCCSTAPWYHGHVGRVDGVRWGLSAADSALLSSGGQPRLNLPSVVSILVL